MPNLDIVKFYTESVDLTSTADTDIYVVPSSFSAVIKHFFVSNNGSNNEDYTLKFFHADNSVTHTLLDTHNITNGKSIETIFDDGKPFFMHQGDKLIVAAGTANKLVVTVCAEEYFDSNR